MSVNQTNNEFVETNKLLSQMNQHHIPHKGVVIYYSKGYKNYEEFKEQNDKNACSQLLKNRLKILADYKDLLEEDLLEEDYFEEVNVYGKDCLERNKIALSYNKFFTKYIGSVISLTVFDGDLIENIIDIDTHVKFIQSLLDSINNEYQED